MIEAVRDLAVVGGPHAGAVVSLGRAPVTIGRAAGCGLVLPDADTSRRHAVVQVRDATVFVHDLGSTNGTTVDGRPAGVVPVPVAPGALVRIGESMLTADRPGRRGRDPVALLRSPERSGAAGDEVRLGRHGDGSVATHDLRAGSLAVGGPYATGLARWVMAQLLVGEPALRVLVLSARDAMRWAWCTRLPGAQVAEGDDACAAQLRSLRPSAQPLLVVADLRGSRLPQHAYAALLARSADATFVVAIGCTGDAALSLGSACARPTSDTGTRLRVGTGGEFVLDAVGENWARRFVDRLAPHGSRTGWSSCA